MMMMMMVMVVVVVVVVLVVVIVANKVIYKVRLKTSRDINCNFLRNDLIFYYETFYDYSHRSFCRYK